MIILINEPVVINDKDKTTEEVQCTIPKNGFTNRVHGEEIL